MTIARPARRVATAALGLFLAAGLAGCDSVGLTKAPDPVCPDLRIDRDTAEITVFDGSGTDLTDVLFEARIIDVAGDCGFDEADDGPGGTAEATFNVLFAISRGPAMTGREGHFTYFVALPDFYPSPAAKQVLPVDFAFPEEGNVTTMQVRDAEVDVAIPADSRQAVTDVPVYIGFQLNEQQLEFNRQTR